MTTGEEISTRSLIWRVGVRRGPTRRRPCPSRRIGGGCGVHETLVVPGHAHVFARGDCAAVPDVTQPGSSDGNDRAARAAAGQARRPERRRLAQLGRTSSPTSSNDLDFLVDLGGRKAAANPLHIPLAGLAAKTVTRGYHLPSLPGNRSRTATDWALNTIMPPRAVQLGLVDEGRVPLDCTSPAHRSTIPGESTVPAELQPSG